MFRHGVSRTLWPARSVLYKDSLWVKLWEHRDRCAAPRAAQAATKNESRTYGDGTTRRSSRDPAQGASDEVSAPHQRGVQADRPRSTLNESPASPAGSAGPDPPMRPSRGWHGLVTPRPACPASSVGPACPACPPGPTRRWLDPRTWSRGIVGLSARDPTGQIGPRSRSAANPGRPWPVTCLASACCFPRSRQRCRT